MAAGKFARSWELTKQAWSVLRDDKRLLVFPLISGTLVLVLVAASVVGLIAAAYAADPGHGPQNTGRNTDQFFQNLRPWWYAGLFLLYLVTHFIITFFQSALLACALEKMDGGHPTIRGGLQKAGARLPQILCWSLVNATVGIILQMLQERVGWIARLVLGAVGIAWNIATFFVVPVLVIEGVGPIGAIKRSVGVIRKTWGESLITQFGFASVTTLIGFLVFLTMLGAGIGLAVAFDSPWPLAVFIPVAILAIVVLAIVQSAMKTLLIAATYRFASSGEVSGPFDAETLRGVFRSKHR